VDNTNRNINNVTIVGLGLIGGSLAKAVTKYTDCAVRGIDLDPESRREAIYFGAVSDAGGEADVARLLDGADLVILALSPERCAAWIAANAKYIPRTAIVSDVCGVKRYAVETIAPVCRECGLQYVPGHPMAGREHSGFISSDGDLFRNCSYILTPTDDTSPDAVDTLREFLLKLGCGGITVTSPENHDRMIAFTSQLPHVLAGAYVKSPASEDHRGYSAGSYRDVSRVAAVDERLWCELFGINADMLSSEIDTLIANLTEYRDAITSRDKSRIADVIRRGRERKQAIDGN
jgi:prephenate dehydrogenase